MTIRLTQQSYGKSVVRLAKVTRHGESHDFKEMSIDIELTGDFADSYLRGDNRLVIPTDTMKNTVYALAADAPITSIESFAMTLTAYFVNRHPQVTKARVSIEETVWRRIATPVGFHPRAFMPVGTERRTCCVVHDRATLSVAAGLTGLALLKTGDSAFKDFVRDEFTTLPDTEDRIFGTVLDAVWTYDPAAKVDWNQAFSLVCRTMIDCFAVHHSLAVQQTMYAMGAAALEACPAIAEMDLAMPNQHRIPVNLEPLGRANRNEIFVSTTEPHGLIKARLERAR